MNSLRRVGFSDGDRIWKGELRMRRTERPRAHGKDVAQVLARLALSQTYSGRHIHRQPGRRQKRATDVPIRARHQGLQRDARNPCRLQCRSGSVRGRMWLHHKRELRLARQFSSPLRSALLRREHQRIRPTGRTDQRHLKRLIPIRVGQYQRRCRRPSCKTFPPKLLPAIHDSIDRSPRAFQ